VLVECASAVRSSGRIAIACSICSMVDMPEEAIIAVPTAAVCLSSASSVSDALATLNAGTSNSAMKSTADSSQQDANQSMSCSRQ
jgi:hypothetical protein